MHVGIVGTGRSGTSMVARMLNLSGLYLGEPNEIATSGLWNPKGYWEHASLLSLNNEVLAFLGGGLHNPPDTSEGWEDDPGLEPFYERGRILLEQAFGSHENWAWKLPAASLALPFWKRLTPDLKVVVCVRNPLDYISSSVMSHDLDSRLTLSTWGYVNLAILEQTSATDRFVTFYEDYFPDYRTGLYPLLEFLGLDEEHGEDRDAQIRAYFDVGLKHHDSGIEALLASDSVDYLTKELFVQLRSNPATGFEIPLVKHAPAFLPLLRRCAQSAAISRSIAPDGPEARLSLSGRDDLGKLAEKLDCRVKELEQILGSRTHKFASRVASALIWLRSVRTRHRPT